MPLDIILGSTASLGLALYLVYAIIHPEKF